MSFLYPLFLLAGLTVAIPVLIHLFNLRRYKTVYFPHTRFLKNIQLRSQKQSQIKYKWLLATRIMFLLSLVLAFTQPFLTSSKKKITVNKLQVVYIDNSGSMSVKKGTRTLLDMAKEAARTQVQASPATRFLLLTNDKPVSYQPVSREKALSVIAGIDISPIAKTAGQTLNNVQGLMQSQAMEGADVYYYSDFQTGSFPVSPSGLPLENIDFYGIPLQATEPGNVSIDTAFLLAPVLQSGQNNAVVVKTHYSGKPAGEVPVLQLSVNEQVKSASTLPFGEKKDRLDTLNFQVNGMGWQKLLLTVNDAALRFDDTFRITARSAANLSVLVLNEGTSNPYLLAAFRAYNGFRMDQKSITERADWKSYNLVVLNNVTHLDNSVQRQLSASLDQGQSVVLFPGKTRDLSSLNTALAAVGISLNSLDTAVQTVATLQQGSALVKDVFDRIPENVHLPQVNWHYRINAALTANQQSVMSFRNGDPFLALYTPSRGKFYLSASGIDLQSGNFAGSYFFVPFLYQMTIQAKSGDVFAITAGSNHPVYVSMSNADERNMVHLLGPGIDAIPPQRAAGTGAEIFLDQAAVRPGFYRLANGSDTLTVALNQDQKESVLEYPDFQQLKNNWKSPHIHWLDTDQIIEGVGESMGGNSFPLWKVCAILALLMLAAETYLLAAGNHKQTVASR